MKQKEKVQVTYPDWHPASKFTPPKEYTKQCYQCMASLPHTAQYCIYCRAKLSDIHN